MVCIENPFPKVRAHDPETETMRTPCWDLMITRKESGRGSSLERQALDKGATLASRIQHRGLDLEKG